MRRATKLRFIQITIILILMMIAVPIGGYFREKHDFEEKYNKSFSKSTETKITVSMNSKDKQLGYELNSASILCENGLYTEIKDFNWIKKDADTESTEYSIKNKKYALEKELSLHQFIVNDTYMYMEYTNKDGNANKEIILCSAKPVDIDTSDIKRHRLRFFEQSNPIMIKSYLNSFNNNFLMVNESIGGGELSIDTLENEIYNIEDKLKTSKINTGFIIDIKELGNLDLKQISQFKDSPSIMYNSSDGILRIGSNNENTLYIFSIYNETIRIKPEDLLGTNIESVFVHRQFDNTESIGYNTFVVLTDNNIYCFKAASRNLVTEVLNTLGFDSTQLTIDKIQSVIRME